MRTDDAMKFPEGRHVYLIAGIWGFLEATLFFLVPDIWTSVAGRSRLKAGLLACIVAVGGALAGGTVMYYWGSVEPAAAAAIVEKVPAISESMMEEARFDLEERGVYALFFGPLRVTPYKVFAIHAKACGIGLPLFLIVSCCSRLLRFVITTTVCHYALKLLPLFRMRVNPAIALLLGWAVFYVFFFSLLPN